MKWVILSPALSMNFGLSRPRDSPLHNLHSILNQSLYLGGKIIDRGLGLLSSGIFNFQEKPDDSDIFVFCSPVRQMSILQVIKQ